MIPYGEGPGARCVLNLVWRAPSSAARLWPRTTCRSCGWFERSEVPPLEEISLAEPVRVWLRR